MSYPMFHRVAKHLRDRGVDVRNPAENDGGSAGKPWEFYMRLALRQLLECDSVMLLPGWQESRGACIEHSLASVLGMHIEEWATAGTATMPERVRIGSLFSGAGGDHA